MVNQKNDSSAVQDKKYLIRLGINRLRVVLAMVTAALMIGVFTAILPVTTTEASAAGESCLLELFPTATKVDQQQRIIRAASLEPMGVQWCFLPGENSGR